MNRIGGAAIGVVGVAIAFFGGAALFDEQSSGWGALPVRVLATRDAAGVVNGSGKLRSDLVVDAEPETLWIARATPDMWWEASFEAPIEVSGFSIDTGNSFRTHLGGYPLQVFLEPTMAPDSGEPESFDSVRVFDVWEEVTFPMRRVTRMRLGLLKRPPGVEVKAWALRNVRFLTDKTWVFDSETYRERLAYLPIPALLAVAWCLWLSSRKRAPASA